MPDGNTAAADKWQRDQERLEKEWEANREYRETQIEEEAEQLMADSDVFFDVWDSLSEYFDHDFLYPLITNREDAVLGKNIRDMLETNIKNIGIN